MTQRIFFRLIVSALLSAAAPACFSQGLNATLPAEEEPIPEATPYAGTVQEIAPDASFIVVDGQKIITSKEFVRDSYLEVDDRVIIDAYQAPGGLTAAGYDYIYREDDSPEPFSPIFPKQEEKKPPQGETTPNTAPQKATPPTSEK